MKVEEKKKKLEWAFDLDAENCLKSLLFISSILKQNYLEYKDVLWIDSKYQMNRVQCQLEL